MITLKNNDKKIAVITGGLGYIGSKVATQLEENGWDVIFLVRPYFDLKYSKASVGNSYNLVAYDGSEASLGKIAKLDPNRTVFLHLAASIEVANEIENFEKLIDANVRLGAGILSFMIRHHFKRLVSTESYWQFDEFGAIGGNSLYAATKSSFSLLCEYCSKSYISNISLVLYDVYGPNDPREKLVNNLIKHASLNVPFHTTEGEQIIDFVHVNDVSRAFSVAAEKLLDEEWRPSFSRYTVRSMHSAKLRCYIEIVEKVMNKLIDIRWGAKKYPKHQIMTPWLPGGDKQLQGWMPIISFEEGIRGLIKNG